MYQSPAFLEYEAAYRQDEALRYAAQHRLASEMDSHSTGQHQVIAAVVALLLILAVLAVL
jgi:hypothetical protein